MVNKILIHYDSLYFWLCKKYNEKPELIESRPVVITAGVASLYILMSSLIAMNLLLTREQFNGTVSVGKFVWASIFILILLGTRNRYSNGSITESDIKMKNDNVQHIIIFGPLVVPLILAVIVSFLK
jgi:hypothetical protein